jgi:hypothetical protein
MANEAVLVEETEQAENWNCVDGTGIEKGAICKFGSTDGSAILEDGDGNRMAGIVKTEKIADDGTLSVSIYRGGKFRVFCHGTIAKGAPVRTNASSGATNGVILAATNDENILGTMWEAATDGESKIMELRPTVMQLA